MTTFSSQSGGSSGVTSVADLDGYTFPFSDYFPASSQYEPANTNDFGFDPPASSSASSSAYTTFEPTCTPSSHQALTMLSAGWPADETDDDIKCQLNLKSGYQQSSLSTGRDLAKIKTRNLPSASSAISRFGQVTPPRSGSAISTDIVKEEPNVFPKTSITSRRRKRLSDTAQPTPNAKTTRRRKNRKATASIVDPMDAPEDDKRKMSLEKNRVAAAKCRVNKKEKTEQMQRESHEKAVQNSILKDQILRMKDEIQHINTLLLQHSSCEDCSRPEEIHKHLREMGDDYFSHSGGQHYSSYGSMSDHTRRMNQDQIMQDGYFGQVAASHDETLLSNPPLPEYYQTAVFELHTPQPD